MPFFNLCILIASTNIIWYCIGYGMFSKKVKTHRKYSNNHPLTHSRVELNLKNLNICQKEIQLKKKKTNNK